MERGEREREREINGGGGGGGKNRSCSELSLIAKSTRGSLGGDARAMLRVFPRLRRDSPISIVAATHEFWVRAVRCIVARNETIATTLVRGVSRRVVDSRSAKARAPERVVSLNPRTAGDRLCRNKKWDIKIAN